MSDFKMLFDEIMATDFKHIDAAAEHDEVAYATRAMLESACHTLYETLNARYGIQ